VTKVTDLWTSNLYIDLLFKSAQYIVKHDIQLDKIAYRKKDRIKVPRPLNFCETSVVVDIQAICMLGVDQQFIKNSLWICGHPVWSQLITAIPQSQYRRRLSTLGLVEKCMVTSQCFRSSTFSHENKLSMQNLYIK